MREELEKLSEREATMVSVHLQVRREVRYEVEIAIEVRGINREGIAFLERTRTRNISEWGCAFESSLELAENHIIAVRATSVEEERPPGIFQVVWVYREGSVWIVGAWKFGGSNFWGIDFEKLARAKESGPENRGGTDGDPDKSAEGR